MKFHQESDLIIQICKMVIFLGGVFVIDNYDYCQSLQQHFYVSKYLLVLYEISVYLDKTICNTFVYSIKIPMYYICNNVKIRNIENDNLIYYGRYLKI